MDFGPAVKRSVMAWLVAFCWACDCGTAIPDMPKTSRVSKRVGAIVVAAYLSHSIRPGICFLTGRMFLHSTTSLTSRPRARSLQRVAVAGPAKIPMLKAWALRPQNRSSSECCSGPVIHQRHCDPAYPGGCCSRLQCRPS